MSDKLEDALNLGPETIKWLASIGITTLSELAARDPVDIYAELKLKGYPVSKNLVSAIVGAVKNENWREIDPTIKNRMYEAIDKIDEQLKQG